MLISPEYRLLLETKHSNTRSWGVSVIGSQCKDVLKKIIKEKNVKGALDYGCGKAKLTLHIPLERYDPGVPEYSDFPEQQDLVICIDVLEHVERECLNDVLKNIRDLNRKGAFLSICLVKAHHILPDGRNAHLIIEDKDWWKDKIKQYFKILEEYPAKSSHYRLLVENK